MMHPECLICKEKIIKNKARFNCKQCNVIYHKNCLQEWIQVKKVCPICRSSHQSLFIQNTNNLHTFNSSEFSDTSDELINGFYNSGDLDYLTSDDELLNNECDYIIDVDTDDSLNHTNDKNDSLKD